MWIKNHSLLLLFFSLFFLALSLPPILSADHVLTDQEWELAQSYIRTLLTKSESSGEKSLRIETLSENLVQDSTMLQIELKAVRHELKRASESVEILNQVAERLGISPENLEAILPTLEQQAEDWLNYLQSMERSRNIWRGVGIAGIVGTVVLGVFAGISLAH